MVYERYRSKADFTDVHQASAPYKAFKASRQCGQPAVWAAGCAGRQQHGQPAVRAAATSTAAPAQRSAPQLPTSAAALARVVRRSSRRCGGGTTR